MIKFKSITVEGFLSISEKLTLNFEEVGLTILHGKNGAGKSTVFNALCWCIYGTIFKDIKSAEVVTKKEYRTSNFKGTRVIVKFTVNNLNYILVRSIKYKGSFNAIPCKSDLLLFKNDKLVNTLYKKDTQKEVIKLLKLDFKIFSNSVIYGQKTKRFLEADNSEKRKIFDELIDVDFIDSAKLKVDEDYFLINKKLEELNNIITKNRTTTKQFKQEIENLKRIKKEFDTDSSKLKSELINTNIHLETKRKQLIKKICKHVEGLKHFGDVEEKLKLLTKSKKELTKITTEINKSYSIIHFQENNLKNTNEKLEKAKENKNTYDSSICPTCKQEIKSKKLSKLKKYNTDDIINLKTVKEKIKTKISILKTNIKSLKKEEDKLQKLINDYDTKFFIKYEKLKNKLDLVENELVKTVDEIESNKLKLDSLDTKKFDTDRLKELQKRIKKNKKELKSTKQSVKKFTDRLSNINYWKSKGFTNKGLKGFIFNIYLNNLNKCINKYASLVGIKIKFEVDFEKSTKPFIIKCFKNNIEYNYNEFSGGEKSRIDIIVIFALNSLFNSKYINLILLDEIFESLDKSGVEDIYDIIEVFSKTKSIYLITHNQYIDFKNSKVLKVIKEKGSTKLI